MDIVDRAQQLEERERETAIEGMRQSHLPSLANCEDCDEAIPQARRDVGGITRCTECQTDHENFLKKYGR